MLAPHECGCHSGVSLSFNYSKTEFDDIDNLDDYLLSDNIIEKIVESRLLFESTYIPSQRKSENKIKGRLY